MTLRRPSAAVASAALLAQAACVSTSYTPGGDGRISTTLEDGRPMLSKDGKTLPAGGAALTQFVAGNPVAEGHARDYAQAMRFSVVEQLIGLGAFIAGAFVLAPKTDDPGMTLPVSQQRQIGGTVLLVGGLTATIVSGFQTASAQAHFQDAINVYNDGVPPRYPPPPPGWRPTSPVPLPPPAPAPPAAYPPPPTPVTPAN